jgi:hypothetical protein
MKTSTKLLIVFFIALPTALFSYNWIMREQYIMGKLIPEIDHTDDALSDSSAFVRKQLPQCKYVVINGEVTSGNLLEGNYSSVWSQNRSILVRGDHKGNQYALVSKYYESLFKTRLAQDTLYMYFYREKKVGNISDGPVLLGLYLNSNVEYIGVDKAGVNTLGSFNLKHMAVNAAPGATFDIKGLQTDELNLTAKGAADVTVNDAKKVKALSYTLLDSATLSFNNCQIGTYKSVRVDSSAKMDITIKGNAIQQYLSAKH